MRINEVVEEATKYWLKELSYHVLCDQEIDPEGEKRRWWDRAD